MGSDAVLISIIVVLLALSAASRPRHEPPVIYIQTEMPARNGFNGAASLAILLMIIFMILQLTHG